MNPEAQEYLNKILAKSPIELTEDEKGFLRARSSYLKESQLEEYDSVLNPEKVKPNPKVGTVKEKHGKA